MKNLLKKSTFLYKLYQLLLVYSILVNLTYLWNFGSLAGLTLLMQTATGVALAMWYVAGVDLAFAGVEFSKVYVHVVCVRFCTSKLFKTCLADSDN